jgi:hypothetical protein
MGADAELVRAKRTEFSFISTKKPFVFFEKSMRTLEWKLADTGNYPGMLEPVSGDWTVITVNLEPIYKAKQALLPTS